MEAMGVGSQLAPDDPGVEARRDNLHGSRADGTIDGAQDAQVRKTSFLLQAQKLGRPSPAGIMRSGMNALADLAEAADAARYRNRRR